MSVKSTASAIVGAPKMPPRTPAEIVVGSLRSLQETHDVGDPYYREGWNRAIRRALVLFRTDGPSVTLDRVRAEVPFEPGDPFAFDHRPRVLAGWRDCIPHIATILADVPE